MGSLATTPDVCIVGAGAAGLTLAHGLARTGRSILLLEGGREQPPAEVEDTFQTEAVGSPHKGRYEGRFRAYGGTTTRWGGQLWPWEPYEFERRPWVAGSGWPIRYEDVAPFYPEALHLLGVTDEGFDRSTWPARGVALPPLDPDRFRYKYSKWASWRQRNMGRTLGRALLKAPNVEVRLGTTAVELLADAAGRRVEGVRCRTAEGAEETVRAGRTVLCCGTIENSRLLLASGGLGNGADQVGRYFMDHLSVRVGTFRPADPAAFARAFSPFFLGGVLHTPRMTLSPEAQAAEGLLGAYGHWTASLPEGSGILLVREKLRAFQAGEGLAVSGRDLRAVAASAADVARLGVGMLVNKRRFFPRSAEIHLQVDTEQAPDPDSRIRLSEARDAYGLPRPVVDWRVGEHDRATVRRTAALLGDELRRLGLGEVAWNEGVFDAAVPWSPHMSDAYHAMGGTRMSRDARDGVVDPDGRVHGTENLFVAGASVFPTGGMGNPTLTLIALALRLAEHLASAR